MPHPSVQVDIDDGWKILAVWIGSRIDDKN